ncbi:MAG: ParB/RepB/Spo0J family partition protein [Alphaproteobacteria bacterium]|nr:ParB/RepB/Spo0J family partition protein [Alphaproteobacteria bacterium]
MGKFGLGRNLTDLQNEMGAAPEVSILSGTERVVVRQIPVVQIGVNPDQPRKTFTAEDLADLAASIKEKGVLQPILLRSVKNRPYMYEIVAGERRYRASKMAGLTEIPALVKNLADNNAMEIALIENVQRENLNPIEEAAAYVNLMNKCEYSMADVSHLIGKSESYIRNLVRLNGLPASVKKMVEQGAITASHARAITVAEDPEKVAREIIEQKLSVADTEKRMKNVARSEKNRKFTNKTMDAKTVKDLTARAGRALGATVKITERRGGAGVIIITFDTRNQLNEIIDKIAGRNA